MLVAKRARCATLTATMIIASVLGAATLGATTASAVSGAIGQVRPVVTVEASAPGLAATTVTPNDTPWG
jgi:hypothetical protein